MNFFAEACVIYIGFSGICYAILCAVYVGLTITKERTKQRRIAIALGTKAG